MLVILGGAFLKIHQVEYPQALGYGYRHYRCLRKKTTAEAIGGSLRFLTIFRSYLLGGPSLFGPLPVSAKIMAAAI